MRFTVELNEHETLKEMKQDISRELAELLIERVDLEGFNKDAAQEFGQQKRKMIDKLKGELVKQDIDTITDTFEKRFGNSIADKIVKALAGNKEFIGAVAVEIFNKQLSNK